MYYESIALDLDAKYCESAQTTHAAFSMHFNLAQIVMLTRSHSHVHVGRLASKQVIINNVRCKNNNYFEDLVINEHMNNLGMTFYCAVWLTRLEFSSPGKLVYYVVLP